MFKRKNRLVPGVRFNNSYFSANPTFILKEKQNGLAVNRFGVIVSKKIDKRAVERNRIKRFVRETLINLDRKMTAGHDILIIIKKGIVGKTKEENLLAIENAFKKAGVIGMND